MWVFCGLCECWLVVCVTGCMCVQERGRAVWWDEWCVWVLYGLCECWLVCINNCVCTDWCVCVCAGMRDWERALWLRWVLFSVCCVSADRLCACCVYNWWCGCVHTRDRAVWLRDECCMPVWYVWVLTGCVVCVWQCVQVLISFVCVHYEPAVLWTRKKGGCV